VVVVVLALSGHAALASQATGEGVVHNATADDVTRHVMGATADLAGTNVSVSGFVVGANASGPDEPVLGAAVELLGTNRTVETDLYGFFEFDGLSPGTYTVRATAPGYNTTTRTVSVGAGGQVDASMRIREENGRHGIRAFVRGLDTGIPLEDALVIANRTNDTSTSTNATNATNATVRTDENGYARLPSLEGGNYTLRIGRAGYEGWGANVALNESKVADARLHGLEYSVEGVVTGRDDEPLEHGYVRVEGVKDGRTIVDQREVSLNGSGGNYSIAELPPIPGGRYLMNVTAFGYRPFNTTLPAEPNETGRSLVRDVRLEPIPSSVSVTVEVPPYRDRNGSAMTPQGAELILEGTGPNTREVRDVKYTDFDGTVTFDRLPPGQYDVSLTTYEMYRVQKPANATSVVGERTVVGGSPVPREDCRNPRPECKPVLRLPERTESVVVDVREDRDLDVEVTPERTKIELSTLKYVRDLPGSNKSFAPLGNAQVRFHTPPPRDVGLDPFPPAVKRNASGAFRSTFGRAYLVRPPAGLPNESDDMGTYVTRLYPGEYVPRALWTCGVLTACTGKPFNYFYAVSRRGFFIRKMDVRVLENTTSTTNVSSQVVRTYPSFTRVSGEVLDDSKFDETPVSSASIDFDGAGWTVGNRTRYGDLLIPNWTHRYLKDSYGGRSPTVGVDDTGTYGDVIPRDNYSVRVTASDYETVTENKTLFNSLNRRETYYPTPTNTGNITTSVTSRNTTTCVPEGSPSEETPDDVYSRRHDTVIDNEDLVPGTYTVYEAWEAPQTVTISGDTSVPFESGGTGDCRTGYRTATFVGTVVNADTDEPLDDATVVLQNGSGGTENVTTGPDGRFRINGTATYPSTDFSLRASKSGFEASPPQDFSFTEGGTIQEADAFELETAAGNLTVTVKASGPGITGGGAPLGDAKVLISTAGRSGIHSARTNASNGKAPLRPIVGPGESPYPVALPLGNHTVSVTRDGYYHAPTGSFTVERTVEFVPTNGTQAKQVNVTLRPLPSPDLTADSASLSSSTDERGLYLQGVAVPIRINATVDTGPLASVGLTDERVEEVTLYADGEDGDRERTVDNLSVERVSGTRSAINATVDVGQLPPGRNNFTLVVETEHGARAEAPVRIDGSRYDVDVLETPGWLAATIETVRPAVTFEGEVSKTVPLPDGTINTTANGYELGPEVTVIINGTRYPSYEISASVEVSPERELPIETLRNVGLESAGIDGLTIGPLSVSFGGEDRTLNGSGEASLSVNVTEEEGSHSATEGISNDKFELSVSASGSGSLTGELSFEEPADNRSFATDPRFVETYSGEINSELQVQLPLEAVPSVGAVLGPLQEVGAVDLFATASNRQKATITLVFDESYPPGLSWIAPESLRPSDGGDASSTVTYSPGVGVGLLLELLGGSFQGSGELTAGLDFVAKPERFPSPYLWKIEGQLGANVGVGTPWPLDDFSKSWTLAEGLLWERGSASTGSIRPEGRWRAEPAGSDRYWDRPGYDSFAWTAGDRNGTFVNDTFPEANPAVAAVGEDALAVYARDELEADSTNTTLQYSQWDAAGQDWTEPATVPNTAFATVPSLATLGGDRVLATWRRTGDVGAGESVLALRNTSLRYAVFDGSSWGPVRTLTDADGLHGPASLASDGTDVLAAWKSVPSGYPLDVSGVDVTVARLDGSGGSTRTTVATDVNVVGHPTVAAGGGRAIVVYTADADGDAATTDDRRIYAVRDDGTGWGEPVALTGEGDLASPAVAAVDPTVAWVENRSAVRAATFDGAWSAPVTLNRSGAVNSLRLLTSGTERMLAWRGLGEAVRSLQIARLDAGRLRLGEPTQVSGDRVVVDAGADLLSGGRSLLAVTQTRANASVDEDDPPDLRATNHSLAIPDRPVVGVSPANLAFGAVAVGSTATKNVTVTNTGGTGLDVTNVTVTGPDADAFDVPGPIPDVLAPGASRTLTVAFSPNASGDRTATLEIATNDSATPVVAVDLAGGSGGVSVASLSASNATVRSGDLVNVSVTLTNTDATATTTNVTLQFDGRTVAAWNATLDGGESGTLRFALNTSGLSPGTYTYELSTDEDTETATLSVESGCEFSTLVVDYDGDGDCAISLIELGEASRDFANDNISLIELGEVSKAFANTGES